MSTIVQNQWGSTANALLEFTLMQCGGCGIPFMVPIQWKNKKVEEHGSFNCPNGCSRQFTAETEADKLKRQLERKEAQLTSEQQRVNYWNGKYHSELNSKRTLKGHHTRLKNKIQEGKCPCCDKKFADLSAHMETEHPDFHNAKEK